MNVTVCMCFHVVSHCQCGAGGREDLSLDQDEEVQCESVRVHVTLDTVDNSQLVLSQTSTGFGAVVLIAVWISEGLLYMDVDWTTVDMDIFTVVLFSLYLRLVNNREIKLTLIIQRQLQY